MYKRKLTTLLLLVFILNTVTGQNVARTETRALKWHADRAAEHPVSGAFSLARHAFNGVVLPSVSENFKSDSRSEIEFFNLEYRPLDGFAAYKLKFLKDLKGEVKPEVWHALEGNQGYSGFYICPFKEENGRYYQLQSFSYRINPGKAFATPGSGAATAKRAANASVLASGKWVKFSVTKDGVYRIDASMLRTAGIDPGSIDPRKLKIYSHQGGMLPEKISDFRYDDLPENAIIVAGEGDGVFDNSDYILFYAQAPHKWQYKSADGRFVHQTNIYDDKTYFFLTADGSNGKRMSVKPDGSAYTADAVFDWFNHYEYHEAETENVCREGRIFLGEKFDQTLSYAFNHNFPNISNNLPMKVYYRAGAVSPAASNIGLKINNVQSDVLNLPALFNPDNCFEYGSLRTVSLTGASSVQLNFTYNKPTSSSKAWLDYYELHCSRLLAYSESFMPFRNIQSAAAAVAEYRIQNMPSGSAIYDVSDPLNVRLQTLFDESGTAVFRDITAAGIRQYALSDGNYPAPAFEGAVANQNLHGLGITQFIIVTHPDFLEASEKLAAYHRQADQMDVLVTTPQAIYNEFSSGSQDIVAIRDFFRHVYYKNTNPVNQLKYAMFMGDASYDYKNRVPGNSNYVPVYESDPKLGIPYPFDYYCSDDFFGYLDSLDGTWYNEQKLEIAVTRMPVVSEAEANNIVSKILRYKDVVSLGDWRNVVTLCSDDADASWEKDFVYDFEAISANIDTAFKNLNVRKVYLDAFQQQNLGGSQRYPEAQEAIKKEFEKGTLIFNYVGHGGEEYLASEKVFDIPLITSMKNADNLPVFFTATCEFSRYDDALRKSAGEYVITQTDGGAVAMFTTVRLVYAGANAALTEFFWSNCAYVKIGGQWPRLGDVYKKLKNWYGQNDNDRKFTLFADPAMRMNYPEHIVKIDSINQSDVNSGQDTLKALSKVTFKGHIEDISGLKQTAFNGSVFPIVYDKQSVFNTLSNDLPNQPVPFKLYSNILYKGENSVTNGDYSFTFVVPKDINYNYGFGKISLYADNNQTDASGHYTDLVVGGTSPNAGQDLVGPTIELFINDKSFVNGGLTDNSPLLLASVFDENGINTSGIGIGRDIVAIIDKGTAGEKRYVLNSFYSAKLNSFTSGDIRYQLEGLADGKHTYTLKVWDVYNNSSEASIDFIIQNSDEFAIQHVLNYPNPFSSSTTFHFDHNKAGEDLKVVINIMTISGKVLKTITEEITGAEGHVGDIRWDGRDEYDDKPARGVYIYRITVTTADGRKAEKVEKLVILN